MDDLGLASAQIAQRSYCNFHERVGGYVPRKTLLISLASQKLPSTDRAALELIKSDFEVLSGVESVVILENSSDFTKDDEVSCRHVILVKLLSIPLKERIDAMNSSFHYKLKRLRLDGVELRIVWEDFIFDPPI